MEVKRFDLYGGAITLSLPQEFRQLSTILQAPSHQEIFRDPSSSIDVIVEITEPVDPAEVNAAGRDGTRPVTVAAGSASKADPSLVYHLRDMTEGDREEGAEIRILGEEEGATGGRFRSDTIAAKTTTTTTTTTTLTNLLAAIHRPSVQAVHEDDDDDDDGNDGRPAPDGRPSSPPLILLRLLRREHRFPTAPERDADLTVTVSAKYWSDEWRRQPPRGGDGGGDGGGDDGGGGGGGGGDGTVLVDRGWMLMEKERRVRGEERWRRAEEVARLVGRTLVVRDEGLFGGGGAEEE